MLEPQAVVAHLLLAWYKVRVLDSNSNVHVAFKDGRTHRLYPARLKLMWHR